MAKKKRAEKPVARAKIAEAEIAKAEIAKTEIAKAEATKAEAEAAKTKAKADLAKRGIKAVERLLIAFGIGWLISKNFTPQMMESMTTSIALALTALVSYYFGQTNK